VAVGNDVFLSRPRRRKRTGADIRGLMDTDNNHLIQRIKNNIQSGNDRTISDAHYLLEKARLGKSLPIDPSGFPVEVVSGNLSDIDISTLVEVLKSFIESSPESEHMGEAIWGLTAVRSDAMKEFITKTLRKAYELKAHHAIYIALIALEDYGENVFQGKTSKDLLEVEDNLRCAWLYLRSKGLISQ
jgi:hypothetical protein